MVTNKYDPSYRLLINVQGVDVRGVTSLSCDTDKSVQTSETLLQVITAPQNIGVIPFIFSFLLYVPT